MRKWIIFLLVAAGIASCADEPEVETRPEINWTKEHSTNMSKNIAEKEEIDINLYLGMRKNWKMTKTGSGLRYYIYEQGDGESPKADDIVQIEYKISLLDGTVCYKTEKDEYEELLLDKSDIETGIQEGIKKMKVGDKAKMIIPSHLGHGLLGDMDKIPPMNTLVIDVHLLGIK